MDIEREALVEAGAAGLGVAAFIAGVMLVGSLFGSHEDVESEGVEMVRTTLDATGALALLAVVAAFIVLMAGIGLWLTTRQES